MERRPGAQSASFDLGQLFQKLKRPQYALPLAIVVGMMAVAFGVQPKGASGEAGETVPPSIEDSATVAPTLPNATPTTAPTKPAAQASPSAAASTQGPGSTTTATSDVAGARSTPAVSPTVDPTLLRQPTQCGEIKEATTDTSVEQAISGVSIKATRVAVYPIDYFRCILMATGGQEAYGLAASIQKAEEQGSTHIALIDLWIANASKQFGQVNVRNANIAAAGQSFAPNATLGGRSEVVVSSGQGRNLSLVVAMANSVGSTIGPMTLIVEGPLLGGTQVAGKYQLFLPTP